MSRYISIAGQDLDYFKSLVSQGISGELGTLNEVRLVVSDDGKVCLGTNGQVSEWFGQEFINDPPYQPSPSNDVEQRLARLEQVARNAEARLGVSLGMNESD